MKEAEVLWRLEEEVDWSPLHIDLEPHNGLLNRDLPVDVLICVRWDDLKLRLVGVVARDAKPAMLAAAVDQLQDQRRDLEKAGFDGVAIIAPHLAPPKLRHLLDVGIGGFDLSGNAALVVPGRLHFLRDGRPARFRERRPVAAAYRGDTSLVARTLVRTPSAAGTGALLEEVERRGGRLSLGTVSKALARLEEDAVVRRAAVGEIEVPDVERLLDRLAEEAPPVRVEEEWVGRVHVADERLPELLRQVRVKHEEPHRGMRFGLRLLRTGVSSAPAYVPFADDPTAAFYCTARPAQVLKWLEMDTEETRRFPNLRLLCTSDQRAYFDPGPNLLAASPVQAWLELRRGNKRQREAADDVRRLLLVEAGGDTLKVGAQVGTGRAKRSIRL